VSTRYTAFIPVRAGSKSIPLKNIKEIAGRPLVHWAMQAADECDRIDRIVVSTDSPEIEAVVSAFGSTKIAIHHRSALSATDTATTEQVMLEYARLHNDFDVMVLVQATSPLLTADDLTRGIERFESGDFDSVLSVVRQKRFLWAEEDGAATPVNYDVACRPRRQEFEGFFAENGAFYLVSRERLLESECRLAGRVGLVEMDEASYYEIDEPSDWAIVEGLLAKRAATSAHARDAVREVVDLSRIKAVFTDCDGVLTDGGMYYSETGDELKRFQTRDGMGFAMLQQAGLIVGIITSESVELVRRRAAKLKIDELHMGVTDKLTVVEELCAKHSISLSEVAYVGDDVMDLPVIKAVGFGCSVHDGMAEVTAAASFVTRTCGGEGAVREVAELILASRRNSGLPPRS